jgi:ribonuclease D
MMKRQSSHNSARTITQEEINSLPLNAYKGKVIVITDADKIPKVIKELEKEPVVGFDTETRPSFVKGQRFKVALLQLALTEKVYLIRLQQTGMTPELIKFFETESTLKVGIGVRDDIQALVRAHKFSPAGFVELTTLSKLAGIEVESVKKLTALLLGFRISKSAQTSNWEAATLTEKQIEYAATDAWVCLEIYNRLISQIPAS